MSSGADISANASLIAAAATSAAGVRIELKKFTPSLAKDFKIAAEAAAEAAVEAAAEMVERTGVTKDDHREEIRVLDRSTEDV